MERGITNMTSVFLYVIAFLGTCAVGLAVFQELWQEAAMLFGAVMTVLWMASVLEILERLGGNGKG